MEEVTARRARSGDWENLGTSHVDEAGPAESRVDTELRAAGYDAGSRRGWLGSRIGRLHVWSATTLVLLAAVGVLQSLQSSGRLRLPPLLEHPLVPVLLTVLILLAALRGYRHSLQTLAFYRRFIRPGLRDLLEHEGRTLSRGEKLFRGRRAVVLKIDIVGYTFLTHDMPYGMRRLFLDLWYTLVDQVVADAVFYDKSLGDGSIYCFDAERSPRPCRAALEAALRIRDEAVPRFDRLFRARLAEKLAAPSDLSGPAASYLERYERRAGESLWQRRTAIRIALVAGHVDEGLWGLSGQSHYDVQGTAMVLAARLESAVGDGEIALDERFAALLADECGGAGLLPLPLRRRRIDVRGMGPREVFLVPPRGAGEEELDRAAGN